MEGDAIVSAGKIFVTTNLAAAIPIIAADAGDTVSHPAVIATRPARDPFSDMDTSAAIIGIVAGFVVVFGIEFIDKVLKVDDPVGAVGVHGLNGAFGTLAVGLFSDGAGTGWKITSCWRHFQLIRTGRE